MAIKKSDLYSPRWASCDGLRGGMDASQYEDGLQRMKRSEAIISEPGGFPAISRWSSEATPPANSWEPSGIADARVDGHVEKMGVR